MSVKILTRLAGLEDLDELVPLFDAYRQFYEEPSNPRLAETFLRDRLSRQESTILLAFNATGHAIGFCQLYPSFCSLLAAPIEVLYDLFISPEARQCGAGRALLQAAEDLAYSHGAARLDLTTAKTNLRAQALYESEAWKRDEVFLAYNKLLENRSDKT